MESRTDDGMTDGLAEPWAPASGVRRERVDARDYMVSWHGFSRTVVHPHFHSNHTFRMPDKFSEVHVQDSQCRAARAATS